MIIRMLLTKRRPAMPRHLPATTTSAPLKSGKISRTTRTTIGVAVLPRGRHGSWRRPARRLAME